MPTTSFDQRFYVSEEKADEFVAVVTAPPQKNTDEKFQSHYMKKEQMNKYLNDIWGKR